MGKVSMCVFVACFNTCDSSHGVCEINVGLDWLWMQIIDVSDGSTYW